MTLCSIFYFSLHMHWLSFPGWPLGTELPAILNITWLAFSNERSWQKVQAGRERVWCTSSVFFLLSCFAARCRNPPWLSSCSISLLHTGCSHWIPVTILSHLSFVSGMLSPLLDPFRVPTTVSLFASIFIWTFWVEFYFLLRSSKLILPGSFP